MEVEVRVVVEVVEVVVEEGREMVVEEGREMGGKSTCSCSSSSTWPRSRVAQLLTCARRKVVEVVEEAEEVEEVDEVEEVQEVQCARARALRTFRRRSALSTKVERFLLLAQLLDRLLLRALLLLDVARARRRLLQQLELLVLLDRLRLDRLRLDRLLLDRLLLDRLLLLVDVLVDALLDDLLLLLLLLLAPPRRRLLLPPAPVLRAGQPRQLLHRLWVARVGRSWVERPRFSGPEGF